MGYYKIYQKSVYKTKNVIKTKILKIESMEIKYHHYYLEMKQMKKNL